MSEFKIACPSCQQHMLLDESHRGIQLACPTCGDTVTVPRVTDDSPPPLITDGPEKRYQPTSVRPSAEPPGKGWLTTFLLAWFLGAVGMDRFYHRRIGLGLGKLLTFGGLGLWSLADCILLLLGRYRDAQGHCLQPTRRSHLAIALSIAGLFIVANVVVVGMAVQGTKSAPASLELPGGKTPGGFTSPEAVFEAMKADSDSILLLAPEERPLIAYMGVFMSRALASAQTEEAKQKEAEQAFKELLERYQLTDKLELNAASSLEQDREAATRVFAGVDLVALQTELDDFNRRFSTSQFSISSGGNVKPVSLKDLQIDGSKAQGITVYSDQTEQPVVFVKSGGDWFLSMEETQSQLAQDGGLLGGGSEGMALVITFDSEPAMNHATTAELLAGVDYDRTETANLDTNPTGGPHHEAVLTFSVPPSTDKEAILRSIRQVRGVTKVENLMSEEMEAQMAAKFEEAFKSLAASANGETAVENLPSLNADAVPVPTPELGADVTPATSSTENRVLQSQQERAAAGFPTAQYDLGMRYLKGEGVAQDRNEARRLLQLAANQGHTQAARALEELERPPTPKETSLSSASGDPSERTVVGARQASIVPILKFDETKDYLELLPIDWAALPAFTVEAWVRNWRGSLLNQGRVGDPENSLYVGLGQAFNQERYYPSGWESKGRNVEFAIGPVPTNQWVHVAMVYNGEKQLIYLNGRLRNSRTARRPGPFDLRRPLTIGQIGNGDLLSIRISSVNRYPRPFQPVGAWQTDPYTLLLLTGNGLEEGTVKDFSKHGRHARVHGNLWDSPSLAVFNGTRRGNRGPLAADLARRATAMSGASTDPLEALGLGALQVWFKQDDAYEALCGRVLASGAGRQVAEDLERSSKAICLRPIESAATKQTALGMATRAVELGAGSPSLPWFRLTQGMAAYRAGDFPVADRALQQVVQETRKLDDNRRIRIGGTAGFYRAMTLVQLQRNADALQVFQEATSLMKPPPSAPEDPLAGGADHDDLILWLAWEEAGAMLMTTQAGAE